MEEHGVVPDVIDIAPTDELEVSVVLLRSVVCTSGFGDFRRVSIVIYVACVSVYAHIKYIHT
jgi:hypothetical protein